MHRVPYLFGDLQECLDQSRRHGIRVVQQRRNQARRRVPERLGKPETLEWRLEAKEEREDRASDRREMACAGEYFRQPRSAGNRRLLRALHLRLRASAKG